MEKGRGRAGGVMCEIAAVGGLGPSSPRLVADLRACGSRAPSGLSSSQERSVSALLWPGRP